jgi:hypothetical protein
MCHTKVTHCSRQVSTPDFLDLCVGGPAVVLAIILRSPSGTSRTTATTSSSCGHLLRIARPGSNGCTRPASDTVSVSSRARPDDEILSDDLCGQHQPAVRLDQLPRFLMVRPLRVGCFEQNVRVDEPALSDGHRRRLSAANTTPVHQRSRFEAGACADRAAPAARRDAWLLRECASPRRANCDHAERREPSGR